LHFVDVVAAVANPGSCCSVGDASPNLDFADDRKPPCDVACVDGFLLPRDDVSVDDVLAHIADL
jgi:hypothetical protein